MDILGSSNQTAAATTELSRAIGDLNRAMDACSKLNIKVEFVTMNQIGLLNENWLISKLTRTTTENIPLGKV